MNNAWFFGDSFTAGFGYNFEEFLDPKSLSYVPNTDLSENSPVWTDSNLQVSKFKDWKFTLQDNVWTYLVSKHLGYNCINKGESGASNERILHNILRYLKEIKQGDIVFLGFTIPSRTLTPFRNSPNQEGILRVSMIDYDNGKPVVIGDEDRHRFTIPGFLNNKEQEVILDYLYYISIKHSDIYNTYYRDRYDTVIDLLHHMGAKTFLWDYTYWTSFESIRKYTKEKVVDGHWSTNGHREFSKLVIDTIKSGRNSLLNCPNNIIQFNKNLTT